MDRSRRSNRPLLRAAGLVLLVGLLLGLLIAPASCTNDDDDPPPTTDPPDNPEAEVESAYLEYRDLVQRLLESPNPDDPELEDFATGENLEFLRSQLGSLETQNRALRFGSGYSVDVLAVTVDGSAATVRDCTVDDAQTVDASSGEIVSEGVTTELLEAALTEEGGRWLVASIERLGQWEGAVPCDE